MPPQSGAPRLSFVSLSFVSLSFVSLPVSSPTTLRLGQHPSQRLPTRGPRLLPRSRITVAHAKPDTDDTDDTESPPTPPPWFLSEGDTVRIRIPQLLDIQFPGKYFLYFVPLLWGTFGPAVRLLFSLPHPPEPAVFNSARLLLSAVVYLPILVPLAIRTLSPPDDSPQENKDGEWLRGGIELGLYVFMANVVQVIGLEQTSAGRAAFLNQLQTVFVPLLAAIFGIEAIDPLGWASAGVAVVGVAILSSDKGVGTAATLMGDGFEILSAFFFALYILRVGNFAKTANTAYMVGTKIITQSVLSLIWAAWGFLNRHGPAVYDPATAWGPHDWLVVCGVVGWTGLCSSALSGILQTVGQKSTSGSETAVILATQPIWASAISALVLGEQFSGRALLGGAAILTATFLSTTRKTPELESEPATAAVAEDKVGTATKDASEKKGR